MARSREVDLCAADLATRIAGEKDIVENAEVRREGQGAGSGVWAERRCFTSTDRLATLSVSSQ